MSKQQHANFHSSFLFFFLFSRIYLFIFIERGREGERVGNINVWLSLACPLLGTWPTTQACALTGNQTGDPLVHRPKLNPLSHTSQGQQLSSSQAAIRNNPKNHQLVNGLTKSGIPMPVEFLQQYKELLCKTTLRRYMALYFLSSRG